MGPCEEFGWGRRIRTPATWSRATRPTTRRSPTSAQTRVQPYHKAAARTAGSADGLLEAAARAKAGHARRRDLDLLARPRVAPVAGGALGDDERAKAGDRDAPAPAERFDDPAHHGFDRALRGGLRAAGALRHDRDQVRLGHPSSLTARGGRRQ